jgi:hypothetical protein
MRRTFSAAIAAATLASAGGAFAQRQLDGTAETVVPGERLPPGEIDARIGWLIETYLIDAREALHRGRVDRAAETLARARSAVRTLDQVSAGGARDQASPSSLAVSLEQAQAALSAGDRDRADQALSGAARRLHAALVALDAVLHPQSGGRW